MTIKNEFIELAKEIGEEKVNGALGEESLIDSILKTTLKRGGFGVFKIHDFGKEKPDDDQFCIFILKNGDICAGSYLDGLLYNEFNLDGTGTDNIEKWIELDEVNE